MSSITQAQLDAIAQHNTAHLVEAHRDQIAWAVAMVMAEHEDPVFSPFLYNYYIVDPATGRKTDRLGIAYADPKAPLVTQWRNPGDGGCQHDPHACGQYQILDSIRLKDGGYGGVKLPNLNDLFDIEKNVQAALTARNHDLQHIIAAGVTDVKLQALLLYLAHAEGIGKLIGGKYEGAFARLRREGKALTWANLCALPWGTPGWWSLYNRLSGVAAAVERLPLWQAAEDVLLGGVVLAEEVPVVQPDTRPRCDALIAEVQAAEMMRDLVLATKLRAELEDVAEAERVGEEVEEEV